ncbi:2-nitropropane dioxygenase [Atractiella rhizophila]|nr:2-nitropropane dioxygenase [Atractiella rhizophila]KAH8927681.1 2-nitropropane dioxygenase [Atractiella rhizophila]
MPIETQLTKDLGIRIPVVQGGMQWVGLPVLVAAVSNAGGLGIITGLTQPTPEDLRKAIRETKSNTNKPFGVNLTFLPTMKPPPYDEYAKVIIEEGVKVVETAGGPAAGPFIKLFNSKGIYVIHKCTAIRHARTAVKMGARMLSIDGLECAGHPGEDDVGGLVLLARAAQELKTPFIASGGFANGRGLASALALGACGINCGTAFMTTEEAPIHPNVKKVMIESDERQTVHIFRTLHNTARVFKNKPAMEVVALENRIGGCKFEDVAHLVSGQRGKLVYETGDIDAGIWSCSVAVGLLKEVVSCEVFLNKIEKEAIEVLQGLTKNITFSTKM